MSDSSDRPADSAPADDVSGPDRDDLDRLEALASEVDAASGAPPPDEPWTREEEAILDAAGHRAAWRRITGWPEYRATPLRSLPGIADAAGVARVRVKDESGRFGLGSFKALGGGYGVYGVAADRVRGRSGGKGGRKGRAEGLLKGRFRDQLRDLTVTCATDGNHGRAVAWGAELVGCRAVIYVPEHVTGHRVRAIESHGARVIRVEGSYDDAVARADADARREGRVVISDTAYEGYADLPRRIMQGYTVMAREAAEAWREDDPPTHVFLQAGVGGMAAAVVSHFQRELGADAPAVVLVEPREADGLFRSVRAGEARSAGGSLETLMGGLSCREVSTVAWPILRRRTRTALRVPDAAIPPTMRLLARGVGADPPVVAGESGAAGMAGFLLVARSPRHRKALELDAGSRILAVVTEGATDPGRYRELVGRDPGTAGRSA